ncbi:MAG: exonuclease domain-containing protein [Candidatus Margulisiibacteriota bacterium]
MIKDKQFQELEKEYKFLARARGETLDKLEYVVFDIETTGLEPTQHEITEIGALKIKGEEVQSMFSSLIRPTSPISLEITNITGIDDEMVKHSPSLREVLPKFIDFVADSILIAHNAEFDVSFIKQNLKKISDKELSNNVICTVRIARYLIPNLENFKLHTVATHLGIPVENRHRAMGDAEATYQIWTKFLPLLKEKGITSKRELDDLVSRL